MNMLKLEDIQRGAEIAGISPLDDITTFLGPLPPEEYEARRRIRTCCSAARYLLVHTDSPHARILCNLVTEVSTYWLYRPSPIATLQKAAAYMAGLLNLADQVEELRVLA